MDSCRYLLKSRETLPILSENQKEWLKEQEELLFQAWLSEYPEEEHEEIRERLEYIRQYALGYPDFDGEQFFPSQAATKYYDFRQQRLEHCRFSENDFYGLEEIQEAIKEMNIQPKPTFELIAYLWDILKNWMERGDRERMEEKIQRLLDLMGQPPYNHIKMDVNVGGKNTTFENGLFIKSLFTVFLNSNTEALNLTERTKYNKLEIDYILIKTLLDNLPIKYKKVKRGKYTKAERLFALSVLWLTGEIAHGRDDSPLNSETFTNGTFDKIMRRYGETLLPAVFNRL